MDLAPLSLLINSVLPLLFLEWWLKYHTPRRRSRHARATGKETLTQSTPVSPHTP
ncbi:hypothetical protein GCM10009603_29130 [Nocardiopsis exhalans]